MDKHPPPHTHARTASVHPYPTLPTHTVSQSSQCEYMNTVNCSDRVNYSVCDQATKHQNALWLPVSVNMENSRQVWYFSRCSNHSSPHLNVPYVQLPIIFFNITHKWIMFLERSWLHYIDQWQHSQGFSCTMYLIYKPGCLLSCTPCLISHRIE